MVDAGVDEEGVKVEGGIVEGGEEGGEDLRREIGGSGQRGREGGERKGTDLELDLPLTAAELARRDLFRTDLGRGRPERLGVFDVGQAVEAARQSYLAHEQKEKMRRGNAPEDLLRFPRDALLEGEESAVDANFSIRRVFVYSSILLRRGS